MDRRGEPQSPPTTSGAPSSPAAGGSAAPAGGFGTNSWARRAILSRASGLGLPNEVAKRVGNVALWYYNRILLDTVPKGAVHRELPVSANRYLVPITLAMGCDYVGRPLDLERILRLSANPTRRTVEIARELYTAYAKMLPAAKRPGRRRRASRPAPAPAPTLGARPSVAPEFQTRGSAGSGSPAPIVPVDRAVPVAESQPVTALATKPPEELEELRGLVGALRRPAPGPKPSARVRPNTNAWARKRIADHCRTLGVPDPVRRRALAYYERIVDLHSARGGRAPRRRLELSPRLNWSLVFTTIYLSCRAEEFPRDLRDILGRNPRPGALREIYRLYRFYKRRLQLTINLVDVRTFICSWMDGFEITELLQEKAGSGEVAWLRDRAIDIANKAQRDAALRKASTRTIAAGALTTALAERTPPTKLSTFYKTIAALLHMSEETIRFIALQISRIV